MFQVLSVVLQIVFGLWWWLISCVSSAGDRDAQIVGKSLFLGVSVLVGGISTWIRLNKEHHAHWCSGHHPLRTWAGQKGRGRTDLLSASSGHPCAAALGRWHAWFWSLWARAGTHCTGSSVLRPLRCQVLGSRAHNPHRPADTWSCTCQALELWENKLLLFKPLACGILDEYCKYAEIGLSALPWIVISIVFRCYLLGLKLL